MNDFFVYGSVIGFFAGLLFGYVLKFIQDTRAINEINRIHEELERKLIDGAKKRDEAYKQEINRLNGIIARKAAERIVKNAESASLTDFVEVALCKDGYEEIDFPNSRRGAR